MSLPEPAPNAGRGADCLQRPLRFRFRQQLTPGVRPHPIISLDGIIVSRYHSLMIKTFACPETEKIAIGQRSRKLPSDIQSVARRKLGYLKNAKTLARSPHPSGQSPGGITGRPQRPVQPSHQ